MSPLISDVKLMLPEAVIALGMLAVLLWAMASKTAYRQIPFVAILTLISATVAVWFVPVSDMPATSVIQADATGHTWRVILYLFCMGVVVLAQTGSLFSAAYSEKITNRTVPVGLKPQAESAEFHLLLLGGVLGLSLVGCTTHLLTMLLAIEVASLPSYVLAGWRKSGRIASEASLKYVLFGSLATGISAFGISLLFVVFGTFDVALMTPSAQAPGGAALAAIGAGALGVGLAFKIAAVPMHFWCPDVFAGSTTDVALFLSVASKGGALLAVLRLLDHAGDHWPQQLFWSTGIVAILTMTLANLAALRQSSIHRLLAWSSIAQAGYMLAVMVFLPTGDSSTVLLLYVLAYALMNLTAFSVVSAVRNPYAEPALDIFNGLAFSGRPMLAAAMAVALIALAGLPPTLGFSAKLFLVIGLLKQENLVALVVLAFVLLNSVISLAVYLSIFRRIYFLPPPTPDAASIPHATSAMHQFQSTSLALLGAALLIGLFVFQNVVLQVLN